MPRRTTPRYPGKLGKKLAAPESGDELLSEEQYSEFYENLMALFDYYAIPQPEPGLDGGNEIKSWQTLAIVLGSQTVPGLQTAKRRGRKRSWDKVRMGRLYVDVQLQLLKEKGERRACRNLAAVEPWRSIIRSARGGGASDNRSHARTLQRKLKEIQQTQHPIIELVEKVKARWPDNFKKNLQKMSDGWRL